MDCARNIITANFSGGGTSATTAPLWQWDYGQVLCITGIEDLPAAFEVHFSTNRAGGVSTVAVGADGQVTIPNVLLTIGKNLNAWIYLSDAQGEGETEYSITIPVKARPMPETYDAKATGEFDDVVRQVSEYAETAQTAADNAGASASAAAASASEAAASASAAESAKTAAETAQGKAEDAQAAAETAAQTATQKAQQTAQDAAQAAQSKADAESAAQRAEAAQTGAESAKRDAETAAQDAADSASAASASATSAGQAASAAAQSATAAAQSAASIEGDVQIASQKASEAQTAAGQAVTAKEAAQTAQQGAETAATNAGQSASTATAKAAEAATSASNAAQSKTDAEAAATRAETAAASLTVDSALSDTSVNPVQNKVVTAEFADVKSAITQIGTNNQGLIPLSFTLTQNKMIDGTDGAERASNASRYASDAINIENLTKINLYSAFRGNYGAAFYDEHNAFISGVIAADGYNEQPYLYSLDVPSSAKYFRFTVYVVNMPYTDAYIGIPATHDDFKNYVVALNGNNKSEYSLAFTLTSQKMIEGTTGNEYAASVSYSASNQVNVEGLTKIILYSAFSTSYGCAFYDSDGSYISGAVAADGYNRQPYTYELDVPSTAKYFRFTVCSINMMASSATLMVPTTQTDIINSIKAIKNSKVSKDVPLTTMPDYMLNNMAEKPLGSLSKGYILLSFDDGAKTLATGTIPLLIENEVPGTFGLLPESAIFASGNESELATVVDAVENHGCVVAMHGSAQWPTYTESALNAYFDSTIALFNDNDLGDTYGAICPGGNSDDTSALVKAVAGGKFGYVFSGNRVGKISYDVTNADGKCNGARSNRFDLDRISGIGITTAKVQAIVNYAAENHLLLCPFWHDNTLNDANHPEYITYFNALITAAKDAGLIFITTRDLPNIV